MEATQNEQIANAEMEKKPEIGDPIIKRARLGSVNIYEVSESELELLKNGSSNSLFLNFAIFLLSSALTLLVSLFTVDIINQITLIIFIILLIIFTIASVLLLLLWNQERKKFKKEIYKITDRMIK